MAAAACLYGCDLDWEKPEVSTPARNDSALRSPQPRPASARRMTSPPDSAPGSLRASSIRRWRTITTSRRPLRAFPSRRECAPSPARPCGQRCRITTPCNATAIPERRKRGGKFQSRPAILAAAGATQQAAAVSNQSKFSAAYLNSAQLGLNASYEIDFWARTKTRRRPRACLANASRLIAMSSKSQRSRLC